MLLGKRLPCQPLIRAGRQTRSLSVHATVQQEPQPRSAGVLPSDSQGSPFHELEITDIWEGVGRTRVRQHVNPLSRQNQVITGPPDWPAVLHNPQAPLVLDLGCGPGRFLLLLRKRQKDSGRTPMNYVGLEIRKPLVERASEWTRRLGYNDCVHYVASNATISLATIMSTYPGPVQLIAIQFPDPHFKRRHYKRRIFQPQLVREVASLLKPGGQLFLQSDVLSVAVAMRNIFEKYAGDSFDLSTDHHKPDAVFYEQPSAPNQQEGDQPSSQCADDGDQQPQAQADSSISESDCEQDLGTGSDDDDDYLTMDSKWAKGGWLHDNPIGAPTEREHYVLQQGLPVYRVLLVRR